MNSIFAPSVIITLFLTSSLFVSAAEDEVAKLANKVTVVKESDMWLRVTVPFNLVSHPRMTSSGNSRPTSISDAYNPEFINNLKVKVYLCFANEYNKKLFRAQKLPDSQFYQYYSSEITFNCVKVDRATKNAHFLFPSLIAERDGFLGSYVNLVGYAVQISAEGLKLEMSNDIEFEKYRDENILEKFLEQAVNNSSKNEGILVPAYKVSANYLDATGIPILTESR